MSSIYQQPRRILSTFANALNRLTNWWICIHACKPLDLADCDTVAVVNELNGGLWSRPDPADRKIWQAVLVGIGKRSGRQWNRPDLVDSIYIHQLTSMLPINQHLQHARFQVTPELNLLTAEVDQLGSWFYYKLHYREIPLALILVPMCYNFHHYSIIVILTLFFHRRIHVVSLRIQIHHRIQFRFQQLLVPKYQSYIPTQHMIMCTAIARDSVDAWPTSIQSPEYHMMNRLFTTT